MTKRAADCFTIVALALATACIGLWLWHCWCIFPWLLWNELRLEPSFLLAHGVSFYPALGEGPVTTWIYGPLVPLLFFPVTLAGNAASALMTAGALNLAIVAGSVGLVTVLWPASRDVPLRASDRLSAGLLCLAAWPASSFQYIQADNTAVAFGLLGNLFLIRSRSDSGWNRWLAAAASVAAMGCKQTAVGVLIAQILWLGWREGSRIALRHAIRLALCGLALGLAMAAYFEPSGLWLNLFEVPARLPWTTELVTRVWDLTPLLLLHIAVPMCVFTYARRQIWTRDSLLLLPALSWMAALPAGFASLLKIGGTVNSIQSLLLFLPPALLSLVVLQRHRVWIPATFAVTALVIGFLRLQLAPGFAWLPRINQLHQAESLAQRFPGQLWFPWNPLITYFAEQRFDHVEDGLYVRFVAGKPLTLDEARAHLPPDWRGMVMLRGSSDWGLASHLCPPEATVEEIGFWTLTTWAPTK